MGAATRMGSETGEETLMKREGAGEGSSGIRHIRK